MTFKTVIVTFILLVLISACSSVSDPEALSQKYSNSFSRFMTVDGNRIHYRDEGQGEVILLLHGTASSLHTWDLWANNLKKQYRVVRMDLPGSGLTGPDSAHRYEIQDDINFVRGFLSHLKLDQVHIAGSSLGGRIAWEYSLKYPAQIKSLTLMNALGYPQESWPPVIEMAQWPILDKLVEYASPKFMYETGLKDIYFDNTLVNEQLVDRYYELAHYPGNMNAFTRRVKAELDTRSALIKDITVPTLILWGKEDSYFPAKNAHRFHQDISGSQLQVYEGVGHLPMEEVPLRSLRDFNVFLRHQG